MCILCSHDILRLGSKRIDRGIPDCRTGKTTRYKLMDQLTGNGMCKIHMMIDLIAQLIVVSQLLRYVAFLCPVLNDDALLIDSRPVFHLVLKFIDDIAGKVCKILYYLSAQPSVIFFHKRPWQIIMIQRNNRLNTIGQQFINQIAVILNTRFVYFSNSIRKYA